MGIQHAHGLQIGVNDRGADKLHAALFQIFRDGVGQGRGGRPALHQRFAAGPLPKVAIKAAKLLPDGSKRSGVAHGRRNFAPVADDAGVGVQRGLPGLIVGGDFVPIEIVERPAESLLLVQHALPRKPGLEAL